MELKPIGIIHTPFTDLAGMPIQPTGAVGVRGTVEVFEEYQTGLKDLDGFSHIVLLYVFHRSEGFKLQVVPFMDTEPRGLFATRAPKRPEHAKSVNPLKLPANSAKSIRTESVLIPMMLPALLEHDALLTDCVAAASTHAP